MISRRDFIKTSAITGTGIALSTSLFAQINSNNGLRIGMIGLDTSHCIAFTKTLNDSAAGESFDGYKVVAAYPHGSLDIKSSVDRIEGYTDQMKTMGIEIVDSIDTLLKKVDVVILDTNDGRRHLEQALPVLKAGKRMFIDKPMAASLSDAIILFNAAQHFNVPVFSSSSLRYIEGMDDIKNGALGKVLGVEAFSPAPLEKTHPDLFWYGIHGVEILFTAMGTGCKTVVRTFTPNADFVVGTWEDSRIGTFRGIRSGEGEYGGTIFGEKGVRNLAGYNGNNRLLKEITTYFKTGIIPVQPEETLEILAFMEAADESKKRGGVPVSVEKIMKHARTESKKYKF
ncbi:MAG: Gfo/Idh/MocA family oxidoreductase [Bacteroidota bacterium]|nr:Gfo/Idh/MocA family oxidoreductase [Bacteroidota bacterium]